MGTDGDSAGRDDIAGAAAPTIRLKKEVAGMM